MVFIVSTANTKLYKLYPQSTQTYVFIISITNTNTELYIHYLQIPPITRLTGIMGRGRGWGKRREKESERKGRREGRRAVEC